MLVWTPGRKAIPGDRTVVTKVIRDLVVTGDEPSLAVVGTKAHVRCQTVRIDSMIHHYRHLVQQDKLYSVLAEYLASRCPAAVRCRSTGRRLNLFHNNVKGAIPFFQHRYRPKPRHPRLPPLLNRRKPQDRLPENSICSTSQCLV